MHGRVITGAVMVVAISLMTGCVVSPPEPTERRTSDPSPTGTPTAAAPTAPPTAPPVVELDTVITHITVRPEHLDLVNSAGIVIASLSYDADSDEFVDTVSDVLGGRPEVTDRPGGHEWFPTTRYTWPGLEVVDDHEPDGISSDLNVSVRFTHPIVGNGISVSTVQGFRPGDDLRAFADELGEDWQGTGYDEFPAETGPDVGERAYSEWDDTYGEYANANAVSVNEWDGGSGDASVTSVIFAPWNFGIGHV